MPSCPDGHESASSDFCDTCGMRISEALPPGMSASAPSASGESAPGTTLLPATGSVAVLCPQCGTTRSGKFCEVCGLNFASAQAQRPAAESGSAESGSSQSESGQSESSQSESSQSSGWTALVAADRAYYDRVIAEGDPDPGAVQFPGHWPARRISLTGPEMRIGRHSASRGLQPEIDLTGPPADPGVSRLHAVLIADPDGSWVVIDQGSENGTLVNDQDIAVGARVPLRDGDRIHLGAWTLLTIRRG
jgi:hypothetical protein